MSRPRASSAIFGPMRVPFLILAPVCVVLGASCAIYNGSAVRIDHFLLILFGAVSAHVGVNALNEYDDFRTGLDFTTRRTPFSGGSGVLPSFPEKAHYAIVTAVTAIVLTVLVGLFFLVYRGIWLLPAGVVGLVAIVSYTRWLTRNPLLCLLAPGIGFGPCMVLGTEFALSGAYSMTGAVASLIPFFLVSDLLLLNQFPDVEPDAAAGRRHLMIVRGRSAGVTVYILFLCGAYLSVIFGWMAGWVSPWGLLALLTIILAVPTAAGVVRHPDDMDKLLSPMGNNVLINLVTPLLLAAGLVVGQMG